MYTNLNFEGERVLFPQFDEEGHLIYRRAIVSHQISTVDSIDPSGKFCPANTTIDLITLDGGYPHDEVTASFDLATAFEVLTFSNRTLNRKVRENL